MIEKIEAEWYYDGRSEYQKYSTSELACKINELIEVVNSLLSTTPPEEQ